MAINSKDLVALLKKFPIAIGCGLLSLILLAGSYWRNSRAGELAEQLKQKEVEGQGILDDIRNGANLAEQYDALTATTKDLESRLVHSSERARNQQYFYRLESDTGVKELNLQPTSIAPPAASRPQTNLHRHRLCHLRAGRLPPDSRFREPARIRPAFLPADLRIRHA